MLSTDNETIIKISDLRKSYYLGKTELPVLKGLDLEIKKGEFVAILGPSGSGKSTLMNIIGCIDVKSDGEYYLENTSIDSMAEDKLAEIRNKSIGFVFQKFNLISKFNALYNVQIPLLLKGYRKKDTVGKATDFLKKVGLEDRMHHKPFELSGGQQQRVSIARALICDPEIILADEPTGNLDSKSGEEIIDILRKLNQEGKTILLITHDLEVAHYAKRIIHIKDGLIEKDELVCQDNFIERNKKVI